MSSPDQKFQKCTSETQTNTMIQYRCKKKMRKGRAEGRTDGQTDLYTLYNIHRCVDAFLKIASPVLFVLFRFGLKSCPYMYKNPLTTLPTDGHALFCSSVHIR